MSGERLQKLIARAGLTSRRGAEELIREGRVTVNGRVAGLGDRADPDRDAVRVDGRALRSPGRSCYLLLNKPRGYVSTRSDPEGRRTVFDLVPRRLRRALVSAGRLDYDSEGLLILTSDGDLVHRLTHPRFGCIKTYSVKVKGIPAQTALDRLRDGIVIDGKRTAPVAIDPLRQPRAARGEKNSWWRVRLVEGRKRQLREMFLRIGHPVQRLRRVGIGRVTDAGLPLGAVRHLTVQEVGMLRRDTGRAEDRPTQRRRAPAPGRQLPVDSGRPGR